MSEWNTLARQRHDGAGGTIAPALPAMSQDFQDIPNVDFLVRLLLTVPALFMAIGTPISDLLLESMGALAFANRGRNPVRLGWPTTAGTRWSQSVVSCPNSRRNTGQWAAT